MSVAENRSPGACACISHTGQCDLFQRCKAEAEGPHASTPSDNKDPVVSSAVPGYIPFIFIQIVLYYSLTVQCTMAHGPQPGFQMQAEFGCNAGFRDQGY